jgi:transketolase N-terminal domain/subunit
LLTVIYQIASRRLELAAGWYSVGMALGARLQRRGSRTLVLIGDGELQEGSN